MNNIKSVLETLKQPFIDKLNEMVNVYKIIGCTHESPIWYQLDSTHTETGIRFRSSHAFNLCFILDCDNETKDWVRYYHDEAYNYFKYLKYTHIRDNHPTVWQDVFETSYYNKDRVISFVNNYQFA